MEIYGSYLAEESTAKTTVAPQRDIHEDDPNIHISLYDQDDISTEEEDDAPERYTAGLECLTPAPALISANERVNGNQSTTEPVITGMPSKPNFSVLSKYKWGTYAAGDALLAEGPDVFAAPEEEEDEEVECYLEGEDDIVLLSGEHGADVAARSHSSEKSSLGSLGYGIYSIVNNTAKKAGDIVYYAANGVNETSNKLLIEAKATLSRSSEVALISVAGGAAAETLMFAVDRSRLMGHRFVNSLQGDPEVARYPDLCSCTVQ